MARVMRPDVVAVVATRSLGPGAFTFHALYLAAGQTIVHHQAAARGSSRWHFGQVFISPPGMLNANVDTKGTGTT
jgi:hypothetical protein